jgi:hypothetical protein
MATTTRDAAEVKGELCPACGRPNGIMRERRTEKYDVDDLATAAVFGWAGVLAAFTGRNRVRLRCTACGCQFPEHAGAFQIFAFGGCGLAAAWISYLIVSRMTNSALGIAASTVVAVLTLAMTSAQFRRRHFRIRTWHDRIARTTTR